MIILWESLLATKCVFLYAIGRANVCMMEMNVSHTETGYSSVCVCTESPKVQRFKRPSELYCYFKAEKVKEVRKG